MATTRQHLLNLHRQSADHHVKLGKLHQTMAAHYSKAEMDGAADLGEGHKKMAAEHADQAEYHVACCKELSAAAKAMAIGGDGDGIMPDRISGVVLMPRVGAPDVSRSAAVDSGLQKFISIDED